MNDSRHNTTVLSSHQPHPSPSIKISDIDSHNTIRLESSWKKVLSPEFSKPYMQKLKSFLKHELELGKIIYPKPSEFFQALNRTPLEKVKVVLLGQDPYHGFHQAHGLCFSVRPQTPLPPSLRNIFKELESDLNLKAPTSGCLSDWARQGVLLLNATLSVEGGKAGSHQGKGWELFTDRIIQILNELDRPLVFVLWGLYAQKKGSIIDRKKHAVIEAPHPSPLSAHGGFFGHRPFSTINRFLVAFGNKPVNWVNSPMTTTSNPEKISQDP